MIKMKLINEVSRIQVKPSHDFDNGISLLSYGMSPNGNHTVTIELPNGKKKSIQTNQGKYLNTVHRYLKGKFKDIDPADLKIMGKELKQWVDMGI